MSIRDRYAQARGDFEYLETIAELNDQVELDAQRLDLMRKPTKEMAANIYETGIRLWFQEHGYLWKGHPKAIAARRFRKIVERY